LPSWSESKLSVVVFCMSFTQNPKTNHSEHFSESFKIRTISIICVTSWNLNLNFFVIFSKDVPSVGYFTIFTKCTRLYFVHNFVNSCMMIGVEETGSLGPGDGKALVSKNRYWGNDRIKFLQYPVRELLPRGHLSIKDTKLLVLWWIWPLLSEYLIKGSPK
jgi:hypothetical protein